MKRGATVSNMKFSKGKLYRTKYYTPYNIMDLLIDTKDIEKTIDKDSIEVVIKYNLSVESFFDCRNEVNIKVKKYDW